MPPRILLVEDNAVSRAFLSEALALLPADIDAAESIAAATTLCRQHAHSLCLIDANLPDGQGEDCLRALKALRPETTAAAITADIDRERRDALLAAGFVEVLGKPIAVATLQAAIRGLLASSSNMPGLVWNHERGLAAVGGREESLRALRKLFLDELPRQLDEIRQARSQGDGDAVRAVLHRLKASCGFVGANRLLAVVDELSLSPLDAACMSRFEAALRRQLDSDD